MSAALPTPEAAIKLVELSGRPERPITGGIQHYIIVMLYEVLSLRIESILSAVRVGDVCRFADYTGSTRARPPSCSTGLLSPRA